MDPHGNHPTRLSLERLQSVLNRTAVSRSYLYREIAAGNFPPPIKLGGMSVWSSAAIDDWINAVAQSGGRP